MSTQAPHVSRLTSVHVGDSERSAAPFGVERPLTCDEASQLLRVHSRTIKRMAARGEIPGHFRFGRWFFYSSELDSWMRMELDSESHP
jgi:excisionase family DNA binding protein